jgi:uncharacterized delta-60 repeat protein
MRNSNSIFSVGSVFKELFHACAIGALVWLLLPCAFAGAASTAAEEEHSGERYALLGALGGVAIQPDGKIVVASGSYLESFDPDNGICGMMQGSGVFRFNRDGTLDRGFHCDIDTIGLNGPDITHLTSDAQGRLFMTGTFHAVDGKPRPGYAMLLPNGQVDDSFQPWRDFTNPPGRNSVPGSVYGAVLLSNGCVVVASSMLDSPYPTAYTLDELGRFVPPPKPDVIRAKFPNALMFTLRPAGMGIQRDIDWTKETRTTWTDWPPAHVPDGVPFPLWGKKPSALDMAEALQAIFEEVPLEMCRYAVRLPGGGFILAVEEPGGSRLMRFDKNWRPDLSYTNHFETSGGSYLSLAMQPDGKLLVAGEISRLNGERFAGLARLDQTGATDHDFRCETLGGASTAGKGDVMGIALQNDGQIMIVGFFSKVNGVDVPFLARLNRDGSLDQAFQKHFTSLDNLNVLERVKVHRLASSPPNHIASGAPAATAPTPGVATSGIATRGSEPTADPGQTVAITSWYMGQGGFVLVFKGNGNFSYIMQATTNLNQSAWVNIDTNRTSAARTGILRDPGAANYPARFYRVAAP